MGLLKRSSRDRDHLDRLAQSAYKEDIGQLGKATFVEAHDLPFPGTRRRRDDEVVGAPWRSSPTDVRQESSVCLGHVEVVRLNREGVQNCRYKALAFLAPAPFRELNANLQLRNGDRRYSDIITVVDHLSQRTTTALGVDQNRRVEDQSRQGSVTGSMPSRSSRSSSAQASSGRLARSAPLSAFPVPPLAGPMVATARPWRTTT